MMTDPDVPMSEDDDHLPVFPTGGIPIPTDHQRTLVERVTDRIERNAFCSECARKVTVVVRIGEESLCRVCATGVVRMFRDLEALELGQVAVHVDVGLAKSHDAEMAAVYAFGMLVASDAYKDRTHEEKQSLMATCREVATRAERKR